LKPENENISFYNEIASDYDAILDTEETNDSVRSKVKEKFSGLVESGTVLDFGGGTGLDLKWLTANGYQVLFCEPSPGMRKLAINRSLELPNKQNIKFINNDLSDFSKWHTSPPCQLQIDAILSNFAAINCIQNIELLFANLGNIIKPGGQFIMLVLQHGYKKNSWWKFRKFLRGTLTGESLTLLIKFKNEYQTVYVHTKKELATAATPFFKIISREDVQEFTMFHLIRK